MLIFTILMLIVASALHECLTLLSYISLLIYKLECILHRGEEHTSLVQLPQDI